MTEYGVLLMDDTVAPTASFVEAVVYGRGADREICALDAAGEWSIIAPAAYKDLRVDCLAPGHRTLWRHDAAREPRCGNCKRWEAAYKRRLYRRRKAAA